MTGLPEHVEVALSELLAKAKKGVPATLSVKVGEREFLIQVTSAPNGFDGMVRALGARIGRTTGCPPYVFNGRRTKRGRNHAPSLYFVTLATASRIISGCTGL